ncbi:MULTISPECIES: copper resistance protein NlpE N-terminal domain-containing protein [Niastella]|uniref:Copper resistance protein NlpE N-terminal domain-containing protein n=1 Tax=Niastella soli TaxID=2821487 RepID=A0ABS3YPF2_9BACT|nr:copper resistance protein NlpE N-terminal domain-containing protein [Niastella soli]MBO9199769.1 copper resistance protein NlpE N-terminal domain-containing protein [Niastella soli]
MKSCFGLFMLVIIACNDPSPVPVPSPSDSTIIDTLFPLRNLDTEESDTPTTFMPGYYTGIIPCTDCSNITRKVLLLSDHTFHLKDEFNGRELPPQETEGRWLTTNDQLQLLVNNTLTKRFAVSNKGLKEVSLTGAPDALYSNSYLSRKIIGADNIAWMEKKAAGIDFFGLGNEPFWLIEIDKDKQISFLQVDSSHPTVFPYVAAIQQNGQYIYNTDTTTCGIQIIITPQFCSDGMSDNWYEYKVEARYNGITYMGCGVKLNGLPE